MTLPDLGVWHTTREGLHTAAQVLGAVRKELVPRDPQMFLHLALNPHADGLDTGYLDGLGLLILEFATGRIRLEAASGVDKAVTYRGRSAQEALDAVNRMVAFEGVTITPTIDRPDMTITLDAQQAEAYRQALITITTALATFRDELGGACSPVVVWPHGFDASFLWFPNGEINEHQPHINFGFSPGSAGFDEPYLYSYRYPWPDHLPGEVTPPPATRWVSDSWNGLVCGYSTLGQFDNPHADLIALCRAIYATFTV